MLFPVCRSSYISFAIGWEVSPVTRNTITHGGLSVLFCKRCTSNFRLDRNSSCRSISGIGRSRESTSCRVGRRRRTSVDDVGRRCRASVDDVGRPRRKSAPGKCFRFCSITQNSGLHDVHSIKTAILTDNASFFIYDFGRKRGRRGDHVDGRSYIQCSWWEPVLVCFPVA